MRNIKRLTKEQNEWLKKYHGATGIEPMNLEELKTGTMSFDEVAKLNIDWYEDHMYEAFSAISRHVPYSESKR